MTYPIVNGGPMIPWSVFRAKLYSDPLQGGGGLKGTGWGFNESGERCMAYCQNFDPNPYITFQGPPSDSFTPDYALQAQESLNAFYAELAFADAGQAIWIVETDNNTGVGENTIRYAYGRYRNQVVCLKVGTYHAQTDWEGWRGGIIFVASVIVGLVGVGPIVSASISGSADAAIAAQAGGLSTVQASQVVGTFGQVSGSKELAIASTIGKLSGGSMFDDFGFGGDSFEGFGYSSGEAFPAISDAQNVDFGFGSGLDLGDPLSQVTGFGDGSGYNYSTDFDSAVTLGATPEVTTNMFGTNFDNFGAGSSGMESVTSGVKLATAAGSVIKQASTGQASGGGATAPKAAAITSKTGADILGTFGSVLQGIGSAAASISGTAAQKTNAVQRTYAGQLTPLGGAFGGMSSNTLLLLGGALILGAIVFHKV